MKTLNRFTYVFFQVSIYATIRILSYVENPRPYLWWHGALDLFMLTIIIGLGLAVWFVINSHRKAP